MDNLCPDAWRADNAAPNGPFMSSELAQAALKTYAVDNGFALVVRTSYHNCVVLACSQGGGKRSHKAGGWAPREGLRTLRTKKVGCMYELAIRATPGQANEWWLEVRHDVHTEHLKLSESMIGSLPAARQYLSQQHNLNNAIEEGYLAGIESGALWTSLRVKFPWLALKDVVNSIQKLKVKQLGGLTEMEALHAKLKNEGVLSSSLRDESNHLVRLFFSPTSSRSLIAKNCDVLLIDCTYQTNKHKLPLLHVVGATGTSDTFTVACCFLENELESTYRWAITAVERCLPRIPAVVVVDHEQALINVIEVLWPTSTIHLCRWHVAKNITTNCKKRGMSETAFEKLIAEWNRVIYSAATEAELLSRWSDAKHDMLGNASEHPWLQTPRDDHTIDCLQQAFIYIDSNKLPLIQRIASFAVDQHLHFGHTTTSRAESAHWSCIKLHLRRSRGSLLDVYDRIANSTSRRLALLSDKVNRECVEVLTLPMDTFGPVLRCITHFALKKTHEKYTKALHVNDLRPCTGATRRSWGLPCSHELRRLIGGKTALSPSDFHQHWYKEMLEQDPDIHGVLEPLTVERTRGRPPSTHSRNTARIPSAFERVEAECAPKRAYTCTQCRKSGHNKRSCPGASVVSRMSAIDTDTFVPQSARDLASSALASHAVQASAHGFPTQAHRAREDPYPAREAPTSARTVQAPNPSFLASPAPGRSSHASHAPPREALVFPPPTREVPATACTVQTPTPSRTAPALEVPVCTSSPPPSTARGSPAPYFSALRREALSREAPSPKSCCGDAGVTRSAS